MPSRFVHLAWACVAMLATAGCDRLRNANDENFAAAVSRHLDKHSVLCLGLSGWPVELSAGEILNRDDPAGPARKMEALRQAGLVAEEAPDAQAPRQAGTRRYALTDAGKAFNRETEVHRYSFSGSAATAIEGDLCYGSRTLDQVVKWEGPVTSDDDVRTAMVTYLYRIENLAPWARLPDVLRAFPEAARVIEGAGREESVRQVVLTSTGWEVGH